MDAIALLIALLTTCTSAHPGQWATAAYLDARGDLAQDAEAHRQAMIAAPGQLPVAVQLLDDESAEAGVTRWCRNSTTGNTPSGGAAAMQRHMPSSPDLAHFVRWASKWATGRNLLIACMGHGLPARPATDPRQAWAQLMVAPNGTGMTPIQFARAFDGTRGPDAHRKIIIVLEMCFSASLEVMAELADSAEFVIAVPGQLASPGFPWERMLAQLHRNQRSSARQIARTLAAAIQDNCPNTRSGYVPVSACDLAQISSLSDALANTSTAALADIAAGVTAAQWTRAKASRGYELRQLCDAGELARNLQAFADSGQLQRSARQLERAIDNLVFAGGVQDQSRPKAPSRRAAVTLFLPGPFSGSIDGYKQASTLAGSTQYADFVEAYMKHCSRIVPGIGEVAGVS